MYRTAIFDMDGTLVDSLEVHAEAWMRAFAAFGVSVNKCKVKKELNKGARFSAAMYLPDEPHLVTQITQYRNQLFQSELVWQVQAFPFVTELFQRLHKDGVRIALASGAPQSTIDIFRKILNIDNYVELILSADNVEHPKPQPDLFETVLFQLSVISSEVVAVGDSIYDAWAASGAGIAFIGLESGGATRDELLKAGAISVFKDIEEIYHQYEDSLFARTKLAN